MTLAPLGDASRLDALTALIYELLDAHQDTIELAEPFADRCWRAHLDYLRALGRTGRELLALAHQAQPGTAQPGTAGQPTADRSRDLSR
jgi:hypothetical protein